MAQIIFLFTPLYGLNHLNASGSIDKYYSLFCVIKNILMRGRSSPASRYLLSELGEISPSIQREESLLLFSEGIPQWHQRIRGFGRGRYRLVWISPERLQTVDFRGILQQINRALNFSYAVIDEVHCLSEWGHDFRTSYLNLARTIRQYCPQATFLGLTATASQFVLEDIKKEFDIQAESIKSVASMSRKELTFHIFKSNHNEKYSQLLLLLKNMNTKNHQLFELRGDQTSCGLIFTTNVKGEKGCQKIAARLSADLNIDVSTYYANLDYDTKRGQKKHVQENYKQNLIPLPVATKAVKEKMIW